MKTCFAIGILLLFNCCSLMEPGLTKLDGTVVTTSNLTSKIDSLIAVARVTGVSVTVFNNNTVAYQKAFGYANREQKDSLTTKHVFYGASFSKAVFGYLVAQLVEEGTIDLDTPLQEYLDKPLPDFEFEKEWRGYKNLKDDKRYEQITARMCLSHTTGFPNWRWMTKDHDFFPEGKIRFLLDPGTRYSYSGEGIQLLQFVIEQITRKGLEELAQERIFKPLGMEMTSYVWQQRFENHYCNGHTTEEEVIPKDTEDEANAAGSMETTPEDYAKFIAHILKEANEDSSTINVLFEPNIQNTS